MRTASPLFGSGMPSLGPVTKALLALFIGLSILNALSPAAGFSIAEWVVLVPQQVLYGQVWRLATYPWISGDPFGLIFGAFALYIFGAQLEETWGSRRYLQRIAGFVLLPAVAATLLGLFLTSVRLSGYAGPTTIILMLVVAFASQMRGRAIYMFPIPFPLTGDKLLYLEGALLGLFVIFARSASPYMVQLLGFGIALAWFRFDLGRDLRRTWLRMKKKRLEAQMARMRASRNLRVISSDDDDPPRMVH